MSSNNVSGFFQGTDGVSDNDVIVLMDDVTSFDTFMITFSTGAADVFVTLDGTNWIGPMSISDLGDTTNDPVIVMAADTLYGFRGKFRAIRIDQNGGTAVTDLVVSYGRMG